MTAARLVAAGLVAAGIVVATVLAVPPPPRTSSAGGYRVLAADLHVHSFVGDGALAPWEIVREARFRGLDVIAITNHNQLVGARIAAWSARGDDRPLVLIGQEITAPRFHMTGAGLSRRIDWRLSAGQAAAAVHAQGGVAIGAHPDKESWGAMGDAALRALDGLEIGGPFPRMEDPWDGGWTREFFAAAAGVNGNLAPIGGSDFHFGRSLGLARTYILAEAATGHAVIDAIRQARTVSRDGDGVLYGDPALVQLVEQSVTDSLRPSRADRWRLLASVVVLSGLALLVLVK